MPPKSPKIAIFGINLSLRKKSRGYIEKLEYRCTIRNLILPNPLYNGTIIVLKITLLHSVSVITNFVIPKRDKKKNKKTISNQYASPPRQCNTGRPRAVSIEQL